jgi:hypothetical protein
MRKIILPKYLQRLGLNLKAHSGIIKRVFFLQGLFLSLGIVMSTVVGISSFGGYKLYRHFQK